MRKLFCILIFISVSTLAYAQRPDQIELPCPAGSSPTWMGQSYDQATGKYRQWQCVQQNGTVTQAITDSGNGGQVFNVKAYGAKGDGVLLYGCSATSGSYTLTCPSASFNSSIVGMPLEVDGASTSIPAVSSSNLVTTIASVTDATHLQMAAAASASTSNTSVAYGTNDQTAIQDLINYLLNSKGGGTIFFPAGIYILAGPVDANNYELDTPVMSWGGASLTAPNPWIKFEGPVDAPFSQQDAYPASSNAVLYCLTQIPNQGAIFGVPQGDGSYGQDNNVSVAFDKMVVLTHTNPNFSGLYLNYAIGMEVRRSSVLVNNQILGSSITKGTNPYGYGIYFPNNGNFGIDVARDTLVYQYTTGYYVYGHALLSKAQAWYATYAFQVTGTSIPIFFDGSYALGSSYGINVVFGGATVYGSFNSESVPITINGSNQALKGFMTLNLEGTVPVLSNVPSTFSYATNDGSVNAGKFATLGSPTALAGTSAGNLYWSEPFQGVAYKKAVLNFQGFENTTATAQTVTFPTAFSYAPSVVGCSLPAGVTVSTTEISAASMSGTFTGQCIVEGQ